MQKGGTGGNFILFRVPVVRGPALYQVGNETIGISVQIDGPQHLVQQLSRPAHKGPARAVLIGPGAFPNHHHQGPRKAFAGNCLVPPLAEPAGLAFPDFLGHQLQAVMEFRIWLRGRQHLIIINMVFPPLLSVPGVQKIRRKVQEGKKLFFFFPSHGSIQSYAGRKRKGDVSGSAPLLY